MEYRVSYEHSLASAPDDVIARIASQVVDNVPQTSRVPCSPNSSQT